MLLAGALAGCSAIAGMVGGSGNDAPTNPKRVGPAVQVAAGKTAQGEFRGWVYRTSDGMTCFDVSVTGGGGGGSGSCSSDAAGIGGIGVSTGTGTETTVSGGTMAPDAVSVVVHSDGADVTVPTAAAAIVPGMRFFVAVLGTGATPTTADVLRADGTVVETLPIRGP